MLVHELSREVLQIDDRIVTVGRDDVSLLSERLGSSEKGRVRMCAHQSSSDALHEMIILLSKETYVRPHKHPGKIESFHLIDGELDVVIFDDAGAVTDVIHMGDYKSGKKFFYRLATPLFHTVLIRSETASFHETTNGPFQKTSTIYAPWAPEERSSDIGKFLREVENKVRNF